jgi:nucleotide-binding universal stress UspA family protein
VIAFNRILCPIDFSATSTKALAYARALAEWYGAELEVLHVVAPLEAELPPEAGLVAPPLVLLEGPVHEAIVHRARARQADLVVLGTHGRSGLNRLLLGSVAEKVVRSVPCPVLTVPPEARVSPASPVAFRTILSAIDYSPSSRAALRYALDLARQANGRLTVLHVIQYMDPQEPCEHVDAVARANRRRIIAQARERLDRELEAESRTWSEIDGVVALSADRAYREILERGRAIDADLIVMGAQSAGGVELMLYGSNTHHVVHAATCPVLTIRASA